LKSIYLYLKRWKVLTFYLDDSEGIYTPWILLFSEKGWTESPMLLATLMGDKYILHIINEIVSMMSLLRDTVYTYEYRHVGPLILLL